MLYEVITFFNAKNQAIYLFNKVAVGAFARLQYHRPHAVIEGKFARIENFGIADGVPVNVDPAFANAAIQAIFNAHVRKLHKSAIIHLFAQPLGFHFGRFGKKCFT